jgi:hypothetical protein
MELPCVSTPEVLQARLRVASDAHDRGCGSLRHAGPAARRPERALPPKATRSPAAVAAARTRTDCQAQHCGAKRQPRTGIVRPWRPADLYGAKAGRDRLAAEMLVAGKISSDNADGRPLTALVAREALRSKDFAGDQARVNSVSGLLCATECPTSGFRGLTFELTGPRRQAP